MFNCTVQYNTLSNQCSPLLFSLFKFSVLIMNDELLKRLAEKRGSVVRTAPRTADTSAPLNYRSPPAEVEAWLTSKGFSPELSERYFSKTQFYCSTYRFHA